MREKIQKRELDLSQFIYTDLNYLFAFVDFLNIYYSLLERKVTTRCS